MAGRALCIGVRADDDARTFASIARSSGFMEPLLLLEEEATRAAVIGALGLLAAASEPGDIALVTFSGHGGRKAVARKPSIAGRLGAEITGSAGSAEGAGGAEGVESAGIWQLHDGALHDGELQCELARFREGVRVLVVSDNCSGGLPSSRHCPDVPSLSASVMVLSASQDDQYADGPGLPGHFAQAFSSVWNGGAFAGSYAQLHRALVQTMPAYQTPDFYGVGEPGAKFEEERAFSIASRDLTSG